MGGRLTDIADDRHSPGAERGDRSRQLVRIEVDQHHSASVSMQLVGDRASDPRCRTGDDGAVQGGHDLAGSGSTRSMVAAHRMW